MDTVSIILTSYNKPQWIGQSIESVLDQTYKDWELFIIDDNSPDPEVENTIIPYIDGKKVQYLRTNVSEQDRYATARYATNINAVAFNCITGKYISYLTDDDFYHPERLEKMVNKLESDPDIRIVYSAQRFVDADGNLSGMRDSQGDLDSAWNVVDHTTVMHDSDIFFEVGGWDDNPGTWAGADAYFWNKMTDKGYKFYAIEEPLVYKRYHTGSVQWLIHNGKFFPA